MAQHSESFFDASSSFLHQGESVANYQILERFRHGAHAIFKARHAESNKTVLLKLIPRKFMADEEVAGRLKRDVELASQIDHPHIARVIEFLEWEERFFVVSEYEEGRDLQTLLVADHVMRDAVATDLVRQAAFGLQALHDCGLSHGGIRPEHLLQSDCGTLKILNVGLAEFYASEDLDVDDLPEFRAQHDARTDIYRLGQSFLCLLTGRMFSGRNLLPSQEQFTPGASGNDSRTPSFPVANSLQPVLTRMLAENPAERYQRADEAGRDLAVIMAADKITFNQATRTAIGGAAVMLGLPALAVLLAAIAAFCFREPVLPASSKDQELRRAVTTLSGTDGRWWLEDEQTYWLLPPLRQRFVTDRAAVQAAVESFAENEKDDGLKIDLHEQARRAVGHWNPDSKGIYEEDALWHDVEGPKFVGEYDRILKDLHPKSMKSHSFLGKLHAHIGKLQNKLEREDTPGASELHLLANLLHLYATRQPSAKGDDSAKEESESPFKVAEEAYQAALSAYAWYEVEMRARCHTDKGVLLVASGDRTGAAMDWERATRLLQDGQAVDHAPPQPLTIMLLCRKANGFRRDGRWTEAGDRLMKALDRVPMGPPQLRAYVLERRGWFLMDRWRLDEAGSCFHEAVRLRRGLENSALELDLKKIHSSDLSAYLKKPSSFENNDHYVLHNLHGIAMAQRYSGDTKGAAKLYDALIEQLRNYLAVGRQIEKEDLYRSFQQRLINTLERRADCELFGEPHGGKAVEQLNLVLDQVEQYELLQDRDWKQRARLHYKLALALALKAPKNPQDIEAIKRKLDKANSTFKQVGKRVLSVDEHSDRLLFMRYLVDSCIRQIEENLQLSKGEPAAQPLREFLLSYFKATMPANDSQELDLFRTIQRQWIFLNQQNLISRDELDLLLLTVRLLPVGDKRHLNAHLMVELARVPQVENRAEERNVPAEKADSLNPALGYLRRVYSSALRLVLEEIARSKTKPSGAEAQWQTEDDQLLRIFLDEAAVGYEKSTEESTEESKLEHLISVINPDGEPQEILTLDQLDKLRGLLSQGDISSVELKGRDAEKGTLAKALILEIKLTASADPSPEKKPDNTTDAGNTPDPKAKKAGQCSEGHTTVNAPPASAIKLGIILCALLIPTGAVSAIVAYGSFGTPDPAWDVQTQSGPNYGVLITIGRLLLAVPLALWVLCRHFGSELMELVSFRWRRWAARSATRPALQTMVCRVLLFVFVIGFGSWHAFQCLDTGASRGVIPEGYPVRMVAYGEASQVYPEKATTQDKFAGAKWRYRAFLPYVMIFYGVLVPTLVVVIGYAIVRTDLPLFRRSRRMLKATLYMDGSTDAAKKEFEQFRLEWYDQSMRYLSAFAALGAVVIYDQLLGNLAMSEEAQQQQVVAFVLLGANSRFFSIVWYFYHDAWFETDRFLVERNAVDDDFRKENGPWTFLRSLFHNSMSGYTASVLLLLPLKDVLPFMN